MKFAPTFVPAAFVDVYAYRSALLRDEMLQQKRSGSTFLELVEWRL